jgi:hypothetical protein
MTTIDLSNFDIHRLLAALDLLIEHDQQTDLRQVGHLIRRDVLAEIAETKALRDWLETKLTGEED